MWRDLYRIKYFGLAIGIVLALSKASGAQVDFREVVNSFRSGSAAVLYSECAAGQGKVVLLIALTESNYEMWLFEIDDGLLSESTQVVLTGGTFDLVNARAGEAGLARVRRYVGALLRGPFGFLLPNQTVRLISSAPQTPCPG